MRRRHHNRRAYSAVELITAIAIGLIVATLGFSGLRIFHNEAPVKSVSQRFSHALSTARSFAVARNAFFSVVLDIDRRSFWINQINDPASDPNDPTFISRYRPKVVTPEFVDKRVTIEGVQFVFNGPLLSAGIQEVIFAPDGSSNFDARFTFYDTERGAADPGNIYTVRLYGPTGHNKIYPRQRI